jgi:hypothetical protein
MLILKADLVPKFQLVFALNVNRQPVDARLVAGDARYGHGRTREAQGGQAGRCLNNRRLGRCSGCGRLTPIEKTITILPSSSPLLSRRALKEPKDEVSRV